MRTVAIAAITIDGKIALNAKSGSWWTSKEDKDFLHDFLDTADAVVVGNNTYTATLEPLSKRNCIVLTRSTKSEKRWHDKLLFVNPAHSDLRRLLERYETVAILGGAQTYAYCLSHDLTDELYITIEPLIFGRGVDLFTTMPTPAHCTLLSTKQLNEKGTLLLHYRVAHTPDDPLSAYPTSPLA